MYLLDTNVISELRKKDRINTGVKRFFEQVSEQGVPCFMSVITVGELRRGVELIKHRGDKVQAAALELWLETILDEYAENILDFTVDESQVWGRLRVPHYENAIDKQIVATALTHDLTLVTRNLEDFSNSGITVLNPFV